MAKLPKSILPRGTGRQDAPDLVKPEYGEWGAARLRYMKQYLPEELMELLRNCELNHYLNKLDRRAMDKFESLVAQKAKHQWRDRGTERTRPDAVDRSDGQHSARSDADNRGNLHLLNSQTAAEPEKPAAVAEQMSLMDDSSNVFQSNTQTAAPTSDVFDWNTPDVPMR